MQIEMFKLKLANILHRFPDGLSMQELENSFKKYYKEPPKLEADLPALLVNCPHYIILHRNIVKLTDIAAAKEKALIMEPIDPPAPSLFDHIAPGACMECQIGHVYDPSKFWVIFSIVELKLFGAFLNHFYAKPENALFAIPMERICMNFFCLARKKSMLYRVVIIDTTRLEAKKVRAFFIDRGLILFVDCNDLFYMNKQHASVRRFSVRASLYNVAPTKIGDAWKKPAVDAFSDLINKRRLLAQIVRILPVTNIVCVSIRELAGHFTHYINDILVNEEFASYAKKREDDEIIHVAKNYYSNVKYLHLVPTFAMLETGKAPCSVQELDLILNSSAALDKLNGNYYKYIDKEEETSNTN